MKSGHLVDSPELAVNAIRRGDRTWLGLAIFNGLDPSICTKDGESLLSVALRCQDWTAAEMLLSSGADADRVEPDGYTPLLLLMRVMPFSGGLQGRLERLMVAMLGKGTVHIDHVGPDGYSALMLAALRMDEAVVDQLLRAGALVVNPKSSQCLLNMVKSIGRHALSDRLQAWAADACLRELYGLNRSG